MKGQKSLFSKIPIKKPVEKLLEMKIEQTARLLNKDGKARCENITSEGTDLRTQEKIAAFPGPNGTGEIVGIRYYNGKLLVFMLEEGHLAYFVYENGVFMRTFASIEQYSDDFDLENHARDLLYTNDVCPELVYGEEDEKLLLFPSAKYAVLGNGYPTVTFNLPAFMPRFEHATIAGGRLYGTIGQKLYISSDSGCFDWTYDEEGEEDPRHAYSTNITSFTDRQTPVTALVNYRGSVLIFRENAIQKIVGSANPFSVREAFSCGTLYGKSIKDLYGDLYFTDGKSIYCLSRNTLKRLDAFDERYRPTGAACVYNGKYCFCAEKEGETYLFSYDPAIGGCGKMKLTCGVLSMEAGAERLYLLCAGEEKKELYALTEDRSGVNYSVHIPLFEEELAPKALKNAALRLYVGNGSTAALKLIQTNDEGQSTLCTLASCMGQNREMILRYNGKTLPSAMLEIALEGSGDVCLKKLYAQCSVVGQSDKGRGNST